MARRRTRRQSSPLKASPIRGNGEDYGKWYRCVICGHICKLGREKLQPHATRSGATYSDYYTPAYGSQDSAEYHTNNLLPDHVGNARSICGGVGNTFVSMESGADGEPLTIVHNFAITGGSGCPLCHTFNWRGDL